MGNRGDLTWRQVESSKQVEDYILAYGGDDIQDEGYCGSHRKFRSRKNGRSTIVPRNKSLPDGTKSSIKRQLILMGIPIVGLLFAFYMLLQPTIASVVTATSIGW